MLHSRAGMRQQAYEAFFRKWTYGIHGFLQGRGVFPRDI